MYIMTRICYTVAPCGRGLTPFGPSKRVPRSEVGGVILKTSDRGFLGPPKKRCAFHC